MPVADLDLAQFARAAGILPAAIVLLDLATDEQASLDPELPLYPASTIKVPLVAAALAEVETGRLDDAAVVSVDAANMTANDDASPLVPGYQAPLAELMHRAIARSDNVATNLLFDIVGRERATAIARDRFGLRATAFHRKLSGATPLIDDPGWDGRSRNTHPAADAARLYTAIARDRVPRAGALLAMLGAQVWNEKLAAGLRSGDRLWHKTGDTDEVSHDGGILETHEGNRYVLVVHTGLPSGEVANAHLARFMHDLRAQL